jgi:hypothetical protein
MVSARRRYFQRPTSGGLSAHVCEIVRRFRCRVGLGRRLQVYGRTRIRRDENARRIQERAHWKPRQVLHDGGLAFVGGGKEEQPARAPGRHGDRQQATHRRHFAVQRQAADDREAMILTVRQHAEAASTPSAIGRSKAAPTLRTSAGARLTVMRPSGNGKPELRMAVRTRSRLSRTVRSGNPTIVMPGRPGDTSTSTDTGTASMPHTAAARSLASTGRDRAIGRPSLRRRIRTHFSGALKKLRSPTRAIAAIPSISQIEREP